MLNYLMVALGGALGSVARFGISELIANRFGAAFPIGTLIVNITGSFAIGYLVTTANTESARAFLMVGVCGGYTTFSAFSLQNLQLIQSGHYLSAALNVVLSLALCMAAVWIGYLAGK